MLDLLGKSYVIEHCIYAYNERQHRLAYEVYVTDRLKSINDSIAKTFGGSTAKDRFVDILEAMKNDYKEPEVTAEQVISSISEKLERLNDGRI